MDKLPGQYKGPLSNNEKEIKRAIEESLKGHDEWANEEVQQILIQIAKERIWRQGLWARFRFIINVIGIVGFVAGAVLSVKALFGWQ